VDDPYQFGRIAAANALSDVYAMGGRPVTALNIVAFPAGDLPDELLSDILRGGIDTINLAGAVVVGGHSIKDKELKYGLAVTGLVHPDKIITNAGARAGDVLYLTKPLGTGLITTGIKRNAVGEELVAIVTEWMARLNKDAAEAMIETEAHAATDITGYGLLGHAYEMAAASNVTIKIFFDRLPLLPQALEMAQQDMIPGGALANRDFLIDRCSIADNVDADIVKIMFDPQTSGGLFISLRKEAIGQFEKICVAKGVPVHNIGIVETSGPVPVVVE
jgi:selenide,water dikinase